MYYGAVNAPNITKTPSYIRASDFASPRDLAAYLLYLDAHPDEYMKYHAWRTDPTLFDDEYLETLSKRVPGPAEELVYRKMGYNKYPRTASCCRLCDPEYMAWAKAQRKVPLHLVEPIMLDRELDRKYYDGKLHHNTGDGGQWGMIEAHSGGHHAKAAGNGT